jgi:hypothetical protein
MRMKGPTLGALCSILTLAAGIAQADITMERSISVEGVGAMAFGNMSGTTKTTISGDKSRTDSDIKMQSRLVRILAHSALGPTAEIVRLDQDKIYRLNINKKEYTETSFEQMREQLKKMSDQMSSGEKKQPSAVDESKCEWLPPKGDVKRSGEKATFGGYDAERVTITVTQPCKDKDTGSICEVGLVLDDWLATGFTEGAEAQRFAKAYAAKMGLDPLASQDFTQRAQALFARYKDLWSEIAAKMQGMKGYPVKTSFTLVLGGAQCKNANAQQAKSSDSGDAADSSGTPGSSSGLASAVAGKFGGLFHKKKDDAPPAAAPAAATTTPVPLPPGDVALITVASQLVSVSTNGASADTFSVPADFKHQETKAQ